MLMFVVVNTGLQKLMQTPLMRSSRMPIFTVIQRYDIELLHLICSHYLSI